METSKYATIKITLFPSRPSVLPGRPNASSMPKAVTVQATPFMSKDRCAAAAFKAGLLPATGHHGAGGEFQPWGADCICESVVSTGSNIFSRCLVFC